jgi:DNA repair protein RecO (recombination protein O)
MRTRETAICLRATDYSETSQVVRFLTRGSGAVSLIAKGSKRPKSTTGGAIDLFSEGDLVYSGRSTGALGTLMEFSETVTHAGIRADAGRLNTALYALEATGDALAEADPHPEVFDLLHATLGRLDQVDSRPPAVLAWFQWRLLRLVGLLGDLTHCVSCGVDILGGPAAQRRDVCFSSTQGGLLCGGCELTATEKLRLDDAALAGLAALAAAEAGRKASLGDNEARAANRVLAYHLAHQLGRPPRMARYVID